MHDLFGGSLDPFGVGGLDLDDLLRSVGLLGAGLFLGGYAAVQAGLLCGNGTTFVLVNTVAAGCVLAGLTVEFNLAATVIQCAWCAIGLVRLAVAGRRTTRERLS